MTKTYIKTYKEANPFGFKVRIEYGKNAIVYQISPNPDTKLEENNIIALVKNYRIKQ